MINRQGNHHPQPVTEDTMRRLTSLAVWVSQTQSFAWRLGSACEGRVALSCLDRGRMGGGRRMGELEGELGHLSGDL